MSYVVLVENNDWEGEEWLFYLEREGNEKEIELLSENVDGNSYGFSLEDCDLTLEEIEFLIENDSHEGYMSRHNLCEGKLNFEDLDFSDPDVWDSFYKGQITNFLE